MANSGKCQTCSTKRGKMVPGNCTECPSGTTQAMVKLCPTCANGRCVVCKEPLTGSSGDSSSSGTPLSELLGGGPTGFGGC